MNDLSMSTQLLQFTVQNYRSIKEPVTLSMIASGTHEGTATFKDFSQKHTLLKCVALFGANASGKSNFVRALFLTANSTTGHTNLFNADESISPFALDESQSKLHSLFEVTVQHDNRLFVHGFEADSKLKRIEREWFKFSDADHPRLTMIFERTRDVIRFNTNIPVSHHGISRSLAKQVATDTLFVTSVSRLSKRTLAHSLVEAWENCNVVNTIAHDPLREVMKILVEEPTLKKDILHLLKEADLSVTDLRAKKTSDNSYELKLGHRIRNRKSNKNSTVYFDLVEDESTGTKKFLSFAIHLLMSLESGSLLVFDEFGSNLHPKLLRYVVKLFQNVRTNPLNAQLIVTAHDTSLLKDGLLARDQIYFTHKNEYQATELYALSDFKGIRKGTANIDERYLRGDYGAIPEIHERV